MDLRLQWYVVLSNHDYFALWLRRHSIAMRDSFGRDMNLAPPTWLVTGAAGFIGMHASLRLLARGDRGRPQSVSTTEAVVGWVALPLRGVLGFIRCR